MRICMKYCIIHDSDLIKVENSLQLEGAPETPKEFFRSKEGAPEGQNYFLIKGALIRADTVYQELRSIYELLASYAHALDPVEACPVN